MTDANELLDLVRRMRRAQRRFFSSKTSQHLREARDLENRVDEALNQRRADAEPDLFQKQD